MNVITEMWLPVYVIIFMTEDIYRLGLKCPFVLLSSVSTITTYIFFFLL